MPEHNARTRNGETPIYVAVWCGTIKTVQLLIRKGAQVSSRDLNSARLLGRFIEIIAGVTDYLQAYPEELPKYRTVMQRPINANSQNIDEWLKTERGALWAAVCQLLFPNINTSPQFMLAGKHELRRIAWAKESLVKQKGLARDIANRIFGDFLSMPNVVWCYTTSMRKIKSSQLTTLFSIITLLFSTRASFITENQELFHACRNGRINVLKYLLRIGVNINAINEIGETPLFVAVSNRNQEVARYLINVGADVNKPPGNDRMTPLHSATRNKDRPLIQLLIQAGANVNAEDTNHETPLHYASQNGDHRSVRLLIEADAHLNLYNNNNETPLYIASQKGHLVVVECLIHAKADVNTIHEECRTPLCIALISNHFAIAEILLEAGADYVLNSYDRIDLIGVSWNDVFRNAAAFGSLRVVQWLAPRGIGIDTPDKLKHTALCLALQHNHSSIVKYLIELAADINTPGIDKEKLFTISLKENLSDVIRRLIQSGVDVNAHDKKEETPLWIALISGHFDAAELLIEAGANIDAHLKEASLLYNASEDGRLDIVLWLIRKGAALDASSSRGITPLWVASKKGHSAIVQALLDAGADVDKTNNNDGNTPLLVASALGYIAIAQSLIETGANVNRTKQKNGYTPLLMATYNGHFAIVKLLIQAGANLHQRKIDGSTCLQRAARMGHLNIVRYLLYHGANIDAVFYPKSAFRFAVENKKVMVARFLICKGAKITQEDLSVARRNDCFIHILAGVVDFLHAHPNELPKYRAVMHNIIDDYYQGRCTNHSETEKFKLTAALCQLLFSHDLKKTSSFVATGNQQLRRIKWLRESFIKEKGVAPDIVDHILTNFLSMPKRFNGMLPA